VLPVRRSRLERAAYHQPCGAMIHISCTAEAKPPFPDGLDIDGAGQEQQLYPASRTDSSDQARPDSCIREDGRIQTFRA